MSLLTTEEGKRRLLSVEVPVIEKYNDGRGTDFEIRAVVTTLGIRDQGLIQVLGQALITPGSRRRPVI